MWCLDAARCHCGKETPFPLWFQLSGWSFEQKQGGLRYQTPDIYLPCSVSAHCFPSAIQAGLTWSLLPGWRQWLHIPPVRAHKHTATQSKSPGGKHQRHGLEKFSRNWKWCFSVGELEGLTSLTILVAIKKLSRSKRKLQFILDLLV